MTEQEYLEYIRGEEEYLEHLEYIAYIEESAIEYQAQSIAMKDITLSGDIEDLPF